MLLSTKNSNQITSFPRAINLFAGKDMVEKCGVTSSIRFETTDYQPIESSCDFRKSRKDRVKEIKWVFV